MRKHSAGCLGVLMLFGIGLVGLVIWVGGTAAFANVLTGSPGGVYEAPGWQQILVVLFWFGWGSVTWVAIVKPLLKKLD